MVNQWNNFTDYLYADSEHDNSVEVLALDLLEQLPKAFEIWRIKEMLQMKLCPTGVVLLQELQRYNALVEEIENSLQLLRKVCQNDVRPENSNHLNQPNRQWQGN